MATCPAHTTRQIQPQRRHGFIEREPPVVFFCENMNTFRKCPLLPCSEKWNAYVQQTVHVQSVRCIRIYRISAKSMSWSARTCINGSQVF
jgi:hypothetical protein